MPPESAGRYDEDERKVARSLVGGGGTIPEGVLAAIEEYRARLRCRRCYRAEEAEALEAVGRSKRSPGCLDECGHANRKRTLRFLSSRDPRAWERVGYLSDELGDTQTALDRIP